MFGLDVMQKNSIKEAIEDVGFEEKLTEDGIEDSIIEVCRIRIRGMTCTICSESIEISLGKIQVKKAVVSLALEEAKVHYDPKQCNSG